MKSSVTSGPVIHGNFKDPNSWSYTTYRVRWNPGTFDSRYPPGWGSGQDYWSGWPAGQNDPYVLPWGDARTIAYNSALSRLNEKVRGGLDLGVTLAELGQTRRMLGGLRNVFNFANASGFGTGRDLANGWLAWQYGWRQLQQDIFGILNESLNISFATIKKVTGSASVPVTYKGAGAPIYTTYNHAPSVNNTKGKAACRIVIELELPGFSLARWTSLNPVSLAWELIPYSFVVDWFYNVGNFLRNAETAFIYSSRFKSGYVSELYCIDGNEFLASSAPFVSSTNPLIISTALGFSRTLRYRSFARSVLTTYPLPRKPVLQAKLGSEQLLSAAALLSQMIGGRFARPGG